MLHSLHTAPLTALAFLAVGCSAFTPARPFWPPMPEGHFMKTGTLIQVTGVAKPDPKLATETQRKSDSRDRALKDAWRRLEDYLKTLPPPDYKTLADSCRTSPEVQARMDALLFSLLPVSSHWDEDGTAAGVIRVDRARVVSTFGLVLR